MPAPQSVRDKLMAECDELQAEVDKLARRTKTERDSTIATILNVLRGMHPVEAREFMSTQFDSKFFKDEYDVRFKEELAAALYDFGKTQLKWDYAFFKRMAYTL